MTPSGKLREYSLYALRVEQRADVSLYVFGVDGRLVQRFAAIQQATRDESGGLIGYQRERVERHINDIRNYLIQNDALLPNAIVVAFEQEIDFEPLPGIVRSAWGTPGRLRIPIPTPRSRKPALVVDGQQRMSALAQLPADRKFPVIVVGFCSISKDFEREQFVLVNKTKPLPRDLLTELIPHVETVLPRAWQIKRVAASVLEVLRFDPKSPFHERVRGVGVAGPGANISQAAVLDVIQNSIRRRGVLSRFYTTDGDSDIEMMAKIVAAYFLGVERVWPDAWDASPRSSRLVHGVGIVAMGRLMDIVMADIDSEGSRVVSTVARRLDPIRKRCAWNRGSWPKLRVEWNELQNTSQDKRRLTNYLLDAYTRR
jgi:DGQHR domain-containing protein